MRFPTSPPNEINSIAKLPINPRTLAKDRGERRLSQFFSKLLEAGALQDDLRRAGIEPYAWVINASLAAAHPRDPLLRTRAVTELPLLAKVKEELAPRVAIVAFQAEEPVGTARLVALSA